MLQALDAFRALVCGDALRLDMWLEPGDLQLLNNHVTLHTRTAFTDYEVRHTAHSTRHAWQPN